MKPGHVLVAAVAVLNTPDTLGLATGAVECLQELQLLLGISRQDMLGDVESVEDLVFLHSIGRGGVVQELRLLLLHTGNRELQRELEIVIGLLLFERASYGLVEILLVLIIATILGVHVVERVV